MSPLDSQLDFHPLNQEDKKLLHQLNTDFQPYADTAYGTLRTWWDIYGDLELAQLHGNEIVRSSYPYEGKKLSYTVIGGNETEATIDKLFLYIKERGEEMKLNSIPKYIIDNLQDSSRYIIENDPDVTEYVLSTEKHSGLNGNDLLRLRHKVNAFVNKYGHANLRELDLATESHLILKSLDSWRSPATNDRDNQERQVIEKSIGLHKDIEMHCIGAFVENQLVGITLYKILPQGYANINHVKVNYEYADVFVYKLHSVAKYLRRQGIEYLNIEQDLGIEGLRTFKQRLRPVKMLGKYTITRR